LGEIFVHSCKHDGRLHRRWPARVSRQEGTLLVFVEEVRHPLIGNIEAGTLSTEFFWTDRWYSVYRFQSKAGRLLKFYCNINTPARIESGILSFIDLDIDLLVEPDFTYKVLDLEEFQKHSELFKYPQSYLDEVRAALEELIRLIETRDFPFSFNP
jgi:uncharacterized protein